MALQIESLTRLCLCLFKVKCAKMALECFLEETKVLEKENAHNYSIMDTIHRIQRNADVGWVSITKED